MTQSTIDSTPIGWHVPPTGIFTNLTVGDSFSVSSTALVTKLNTDMIDGYQASDFVLSEGDSNAGKSRINAKCITDTTLTQTDIVFGDVDAYLLNLDVSSGTVIFASGQISGNSIAGETVSSDVTGNSGTNGPYTTDYTDDETILTAKNAGQPITLLVPEDTLIGRFGGNIAALNLLQLSQMLDIVPNNLYIDNSIIKADVAQTPEPLTAPEGTIVGSQTRRLIKAFTPDPV
ncbi:hypothetical protein BDK51DRAFT_49559 [Blyttiomyces helicus]|uniref:Uncharacterized protein n=1 Tax=Blyttiomyces helicus TaxID=388810 RepID=A0A4P9WMI5_9FUNG|nr:hypothetical protein BDK51DRAFT_49559 [Blyttiomyces helicus]|eukprot:RKO94124.1 hypothetical protein BDK51DRAFT_49559 [Blyttiomyces helicus]